MRLNYQKELTPVIFGESPVRILTFHFGAGESGFEQHWHERMEFHLVRSGSLELTCDDRVITVCPGEVSIIAPGVSHGGSPGESGVEYDVVMFDIEQLSNAAILTRQYLKPIISGDVRFLPKTNARQVVTLMKKIIRESRGQTGHPLETAGELYRLLGLLWKFCVEEYKDKPQSSDKIHDIIRYIDAHFAEGLSVSAICKEYGYSEPYFCRKFKSVTGLTAAKYIQTCRLEEAKRLLEKTNESVKEIALSCGFSVPSYFINCFRNTYGVSPAKYRRRCFSAAPVAEKQKCGCPSPKPIYIQVY